MIAPDLEQIAHLLGGEFRMQPLLLKLGSERIASAVASSNKLAIRSASIQHTTRYTQLSAAPFEDSGGRGFRGWA
jgi:hypothetical protein